MSKAAELAALIGSQTALSNRNLIINGAMQVAQRGTSTSTINTYLVDRFRSWGGGVHTMSRTDDISTYLNSRYALRIQRNSGSTDTTFLGTAQGIESANCFPIIGKTVTLSFKAKAGANFSASSNTLVSSIFYGTGNDENPLAMTGQISVAQNNTLTTSVQEFTQTVSIPSSARQVTVAFSYTPTGTAGANDWYETTEVQLEVGETATPFEHRSYADELARCQRYYEKSLVLQYYQLPTSSGAQVQRQHNRYQVQKRATASLTQTKDSGSSATSVGNTGGNLDGILHSFGGNNGEIIYFSWTADAEL